MKRLILLSVLLLVVGATASAQNNVPPEVREMAHKVMMPVVYNADEYNGYKTIGLLEDRNN
jgi:hypothetical protein